METFLFLCYYVPAIYYHEALAWSIIAQSLLSYKTVCIKILYFVKKTQWDILWSMAKAKKVINKRDKLFPLPKEITKKSQKNLCTET